MSSFLGLQYKRECKFKQDERAERIRKLPPGYHTRLTADDRNLLAKPVEQVVKEVKAGFTRPRDVLHTYGKAALQVHAKTNCLTEVMIAAADEWLAESERENEKDDDDEDGGEAPINLDGPLAGFPVSLKDTIVVGGFDATVGYSSFSQQIQPEDGPMVQLIKDAGGVPFVKTNLPITLLSFESTNAVWGRCTNPHNSKYSPGGSTGGEAALLAGGGSRIGFGSDVAGSVRLPAHNSGCYSLKCSTGRWPKLGFRTSMPGQEGVPSVYSPMARTLGDLTYFTRAIVSMQPWRYDYSVHRLAWSTEIEREYGSKSRKLRVGVLETDGVVDPSPACKRALDMVVDALVAAGHEVVRFQGSGGSGDDKPGSPPDTYEGLRLASLLLNTDGCATYDIPRRWGEWQDSGAAQLRFLAVLPSPLRYLYYLWVKYVRRDNIWAGLVRDWRAKTAIENWQLVSKREAYRDKWFNWWSESEIDVLVTPPNATPALPHDAMKDAVSSCGYTFLFNLLDYTAGILPVTHVDKNKDGLDKGFSLRKLNGVAQGAYKHYDAEAMHGLPVGVQVVGRRLEEEKVLAVMKRVEDALGANKYQLLELD